LGYTINKLEDDRLSQLFYHSLTGTILYAFVSAKTKGHRDYPGGTFGWGRSFPKELPMINGMLKILAFNGVPLTKVLHFCK
jgi:hypothetical protein